MFIDPHVSLASGSVGAACPCRSYGATSHFFSGYKHFAPPERDLELKLRSELHYSWTTDSTGNSSEVRAAQLKIGSSKVRAVENVEYVPTKLEARGFADLGAFQDSEVEARLRGRSKYVSSETAVLAQR